MRERATETATYDPARAPGAWWDEVSHVERVDRVAAYHRRRGTTVESTLDHAARHVAIESLLRDDGEPAAGMTLARLIAEGLSRHDAVHRMAETFVQTMWEASTLRRKFDPRAELCRRFALLRGLPDKRATPDNQ